MIMISGWRHFGYQLPPNPARRVLASLSDIDLVSWLGIHKPEIITQMAGYIPNKLKAPFYWCIQIWNISSHLMSIPFKRVAQYDIDNHTAYIAFILDPDSMRSVRYKPQHHGKLRECFPRYFSDSIFTHNMISVPLKQLFKHYANIQFLVLDSRLHLILKGLLIPIFPSVTRLWLIAFIALFVFPFNFSILDTAILFNMAKKLPSNL